MTRHARCQDRIDLLVTALHAADLHAVNLQRGIDALVAQNETLTRHLDNALDALAERLDPQWALMVESDAALRVRCEFLREQVEAWKAKAERYEAMARALHDEMQQFTGEVLAVLADEAEHREGAS